MNRRLRQMVKFRDQLPGSMARVDAPLPAAGQDVIDGDLGVLEVQRNRNQGRIDFWYARQWELEGHLYHGPVGRAIN
ncbi:MAG: hypothetical protein ACYDAL_12050 [Candidatus Dormibacteraceae bacterium]